MQLVEQLRFLIASGRYAVDETLPSTRRLAEQLDVSFHTVRKAYQKLDEEGLLEARPGSGYRVRERAPLGKSERIERGASLVQEVVQRLIGLGLSEPEITTLFDEHLATLAGPPTPHKLLFAAPYRELAELAAEQISRALQQPVVPVLLGQLIHHQDADFVIARFVEVQAARTRLPRADALGVVIYLSPAVLDRAARLLAHETLGLVARDAASLAPLIGELRALTGFSGQVLGTPLDAGPSALQQTIEQSDLLLFTPASRRRLQPLLRSERPHAALTPIVSAESLAALREAIPSI